MYNYHGKQFKTAQDLQDEIFRNMSVDKRIKVASGLWQLGKAINSDKIDYRKIYRVPLEAVTAKRDSNKKR